MTTDNQWLQNEYPLETVRLKFFIIFLSQPNMVSFIRFAISYRFQDLARDSNTIFLLKI